MGRTHTNRPWFLAICVALLTWGQAAAPVGAETPAPSSERLTLEASIQEALQRNPRVRQAQAGWEAARQRIHQAAALPDPTVGYTIMGPMLETRVGPQKNAFSIEQDLPFPGKLWEQRQMAAQEARALEAAYHAAERDIIQDVSKAFYDLYALDASLRVLDDLHAVLSNVQQLAQSRYASRGSAQRDVAKAQVELSDLMERQLMLRQQRQTVAAHYNALLDRAPTVPVGTPVEPSLPTLTLRLDRLLDDALEHRPEVRANAALVRRDRHAKTLATLAYVPDVSVGFEYVRIGRGSTTDPNDGRDAWMVPLKVTLPFWQNRLVPAVAEARRNLAASEARLKQTENTTAYEVQDAYYRYNAARQTVELYESALLPQAELAFRSDQAGYEAGTTDVLNLLDSERVLLNAKLAYYRAVGETLKSVVDVAHAVGSDVTDPDRTPPAAPAQGGPRP